MWEEAWFSISIREITFREQELNWLFAKYKRLENNLLYGKWLKLFFLCFSCSFPGVADAEDARPLPQPEEE